VCAKGFDAVRLIGEFGPPSRRWRVDGFFSQPVEVDPQVFRDWGDQDQTFWGVYATSPFGAIQGAGIDLYYLGLRHPDAVFNQGVADELRHTVGSRLFGKTGPWDYNCEAILQFGEFGSGDIFAWSVATDINYTLEAVPMQPRLGIEVSIISGDDDPEDGDLGTFNALFPRGNYFGESSLIGPANLINLHPNVRLKLTKDITLEPCWDFFWRYSTDDGIYNPAGILVQAPNGSDERYIGSEASLLLNWQVNREFSVRAGYSHFFAGSFLKDAGPGEDVDYFSVTLAYRF
jgi:Alginate export